MLLYHGATLEVTFSEGLQITFCDPEKIQVNVMNPIYQNLVYRGTDVPMTSLVNLPKLTYPKLFSFFFSVPDVCRSSYLEVYQRPENHRPPNFWDSCALLQALVSCSLELYSFCQQTAPASMKLYVKCICKDKMKTGQLHFTDNFRSCFKCF